MPQATQRRTPLTTMVVIATRQHGQLRLRSMTGPLATSSCSRKRLPKERQCVHVASSPFTAIVVGSRTTTPDYATLGPDDPHRRDAVRLGHRQLLHGLPRLHVD